VLEHIPGIAHLTKINQTLLVAMSTLVALLIAATLVAQIRFARHPDRRYGALRLRLKTWWAVVTLLTLVFITNHAVAVLMLAVISFLAFKEFFSLVPTRRADYKVLFWAYLAVPLQYYWAYLGWYGMFIIFIPVYFFLLLPMRMVIVGETRGFLRASGLLHWGLMTTVFCLSHLAGLLMLPHDAASRYNGFTLLFFLLMLTYASESVQQWVDSRFGKRIINEKISETRTREGLAVAVIFSGVLGYFVAPYFTPIDDELRYIVGGCIAFGGYIGESIVSAIRRDLRLKEFGAVLAGQGGVLERLDSLMFTAPLFFHVVYYFYYPVLLK
jgi:phosphatidate cytidylyltransferase